MTKWKDEQKAMLKLEPMDIDDDHWMYETPAGLEIFEGARIRKGAGSIGTIKMNTIFAFIKRWEKAKKGQSLNKRHRSNKELVDASFPEVYSPGDYEADDA